VRTERSAPVFNSHLRLIALWPRGIELGGESNLSIRLIRLMRCGKPAQKPDRLGKSLKPAQA